MSDPKRRGLFDAWWAGFRWGIPAGIVLSAVMFALVFAAFTVTR